MHAYRATKSVHHTRVAVSIPGSWSFEDCVLCASARLEEKDEEEEEEGGGGLKLKAPIHIPPPPHTHAHTRTHMETSQL
jgi:hypothetical protein